MTTDPNATKATGSLLSDALSQMGRLVRGEVALARAEVEENLRAAAAGVGMLVAAAVIALTALNVLAAALVAALSELGIEGAWAALIVGGLLAVVALTLAMTGANRLKATSLTPDRTAANLRRDAETLRETYAHDKHQ